MKKLQKLLIAFAIAPILFIGACKKDANKVNKQKVTMESVSLASASGFVVLSGASVTNTGETVITGDPGLSPGTSVGGFPPGVLNGTLRVNDEIANKSKLDLSNAYNDAIARTSKDIVTLSGNIGGLTLTPGLYKSTSSLEISSGDFTFDAKGDANDVFIIQIASTLTTTSDRKVMLKDNVSEANIFWLVSKSASFRTTSVFKGTVMALESFTFKTSCYNLMEEFWLEMAQLPWTVILL